MYAVIWVDCAGSRHEERFGTYSEACMEADALPPWYDIDMVAVPPIDFQLHAAVQHGLDLLDRREVLIERMEETLKGGETSEELQHEIH